MADISRDESFRDLAHNLRQRGFTLIELILALAVGAAVIFSGLSLWSKVHADMNLRERISLIRLVVNEFEVLDKAYDMPTGIYQHKIANGTFGIIDPGVIPRNTQVMLQQETAGSVFSRMVYFWFVDDRPEICNGLKIGLKSNNNYYFNGFSSILNEWLSLECRPSPTGKTIIEMRVPYVNGEAWVRAKGYQD